MSEYLDNYAGGADEGMMDPMVNGGNGIDLEKKEVVKPKIYIVL